MCSQVLSQEEKCVFQAAEQGDVAEENSHINKWIFSRLRSGIFEEKLD